LFRPYFVYLDAEVAKRKEIETAEARAKEMIQQAEQEARQKIESSLADASHIRTDARAAAESESKRILESAEQSAKEALAQGQEQVYREKTKIEAELKQKTLEIAFRLNEKLFEKPEAHRDFLSKIAK
jgi:F-type H+-transporting ATPase subunit b